MIWGSDIQSALHHQQIKPQFRAVISPEKLEVT